MRLLPELKKHGVEPKVLFMAEDPERAPHAKALEQMGVEVEVTKFPQSTEERTRWYLQRVKDDPPDVFVPNQVLPAYYAAAWIKAAGIPTVGVIHSDDPFYQGVQDGFLNGEEFFKLSAVVCVSDYLVEQVVQRRLKNVCIEKIPCAVPLVADAVDCPDDVLRIIYVGRLVEEQKRISDLARALCRVKQDVPGVVASLVGEGEGRKNVEDILLEQGQDLSQWLPGVISYDKIQNHFLSGQHVFALLSDYEGLPVALMEAMACGVVPVCMAMKSGVPELVRNNVNGLIVYDRGDSFVAAIRRLKEEPGLWRRLSLEARKTIRDEYSNDVAAVRWLKLFDRLFAQQTSKRPIEIPETMKLPHKHPGLDMMFSPDLSSRRAVYLYRARQRLKSLFRGPGDS